MSKLRKNMNQIDMPDNRTDWTARGRRALANFKARQDMDALARVFGKSEVDNDGMETRDTS